MKHVFHTQRLKLYLVLGALYLLLWLLHTVISEPETFFRRCVNNVWLISYLVVVNYILFEHTLPFIKLTWKRLLIAPLLLIVHLLLYSFGLYVWRHIGIELHIYFQFRIHPSIESGVEYHFPYSIMSVFFFGVIKYTYDYRKLKEATQQLRIEKQEAELNYLKAQTNPHFLFNTLNNIYSLARDKSELAPESILRLSKILRFMLYEAGGEYVSIEQELKIIDDYVALEKLRYDDTLHVHVNYDIEDMKQPVPPLLLIPLIENAFKHGASETRHQPFVDIYLSVRQQNLECVVKNSIEHGSQEPHVKESIGLSNLRRQLELLYAEYSLNVWRDISVFHTRLSINLASHV
jgi:two-component system, LytTR family, sensor kinase